MPRLGSARVNSESIQQEPGPGDSATPASITAAVDRLSARMFTVALAAVAIISTYTLGSSALRPDAAKLGCYLAATAFAAGSALAFRGRAPLLRAVRRRPALVVTWTAGGLAVLWTDASPASTYFILPASGIAVAAVLGYSAWAFAAAALAVAGTLAGLVAWDLETGVLTTAEATERIVTSAAIDLLTACVLALPIWIFRRLMVEVPAIVTDRRGTLPSGRPRGLVGGAMLLSPAADGGGWAETRARFGTLTDAERRVVRLLTEGLAPKVAAATLGVKTSTVRSHIKAAKAKTGARTLTGLCALAVDARLADPSEAAR